MRRYFPHLALGLVLTTGAGCASRAPTARSEDRQTDLALDDDALRQLRQSLAALPVREEEPFIEFVSRARAALIVEDDATLRALAIRLPDEPALVDDEAVRRAFPLLFARWARGFLRAQRIEALTRVIKHRTVNAPDAETPGRSPAFDALEGDLEGMARAMKLRFDHVDHVAYEIRPQALDDNDAARRRDAIGVLVHADVVPADEPGWSVPPFAGVVEDDRIIGRGAIDDKGPMIAALFVLGAMEASGVPFTRSSLLMVGTSEETHWTGIERYRESRTLPDQVVVADGAFPVGVGEKGLATIKVRSGPFDPATAITSDSDLQLLSIKGGQVSNQVPAEAEAILAPVPGRDRVALVEALARQAAAHGEGAIKVEALSDAEIRVSATGRAAHSAEPEKGKNAIGALVRFLVHDVKLLATPCTGLLTVLERKVGVGHDAAPLGLTNQRLGYTPATVNLGLLTTDEARACEATLNLRWPPPETTGEVIDRVKMAMSEAGASLVPPVVLEVQGGGLDPIETDGQSPLVAALVDAYSTVTGKPGSLVRISGTTYAKAVPGAVTFGPSPPGHSEARLHGPDEYIGIDEFDALVEMYAFALARLGM